MNDEFLHNPAGILHAVDFMSYLLFSRHFGVSPSTRSRRLFVEFCLIVLTAS